jgi:Fic family protein
MDDLVGFMARTDLPVLVQVAIAHAQFETIHPFIDGNGRTGRALMHAMLRAAGVVRNATVPVSAGLLSNVGEYVGSLTAFRDGDIRPIVQLVADAAQKAVALQHWLGAELDDLFGLWQETARPRRGSALSGLLHLAIGQPALTPAVVVDHLGVSLTAARNALDQGVDAGILTMANDKKRNRVWLAPEVLDLLDDFAARAGRRQTSTIG